MAGIPSSENVDILVAGLGPAGARAADIAAQAGARVLAIDRKKAPGDPVQCAEFVPAMLRQDEPDLKDTIAQQILAMRSFVEGQTCDVTEDFRGRMIDRQAFDTALVASARSHGAVCEFGCQVSEITEEGVVGLSDGRQISPSILIGADGPRSKVGAALGLRIEDLVETRQITVALKLPHDATDIFLRADIVGGYAWLFPKGDLANLGLGVVPSARLQLKPLLTDLHRRLINEGRVGEKILYRTGGAIPTGGITGLQGQLGNVAVVLAGDAAGLTNPITGAGIPAAVLSGSAAGEAAIAYLAGDQDALPDYDAEMRDLFAASLDRALHRRRELLAAHERGNQINATALRRSWIAYDTYWSA